MADVKIENEGISSKDGLNSLELAMDHDVVKTENEGLLEEEKKECREQERKITASEQRFESSRKTSDKYDEIERLLEKKIRERFEHNRLLEKKIRERFEHNRLLEKKIRERFEHNRLRLAEVEESLKKQRLWLAEAEERLKKQRENAASKQRLESILKTSVSNDQMKMYLHILDITTFFRENAACELCLESSPKTSGSYDKMKRDLRTDENEDFGIQKLFEDGGVRTDTTDTPNLPNIAYSEGAFQQAPIRKAERQASITGNDASEEGRIGHVKNTSVNYEGNSKTSRGKNKFVYSHANLTDRDLRSLIVENFSILMDEINPSRLVQYMNDVESDIEVFVADLDKLPSRNERALRFLLEIVLNNSSALHSFWNAVNLEHNYCYTMIVDKWFEPVKLPDKHICTKCSKKAFTLLCRNNTSIPMEFFISLFENHCLSAEKLYQIIYCTDKTTRLQTFQNSLSFCNITWTVFAAPLSAMSTRDVSKTITVLDKVGFIPCSNCNTFYKSVVSQNECRNTCSTSANAVCKVSTEVFFSGYRVGNIAFATINVEQGKEALVKSILNERNNINFSIKKYGEIKNAWSGSVTIAFEVIRGDKNPTIQKESILNMIREFTETKAVQSHMEENENEIKITVSISDEEHLDKDLISKQVVLLQHYNTILGEINAKDFLEIFSSREIIEEVEFKKAFPFETMLRKECSKLFLEYVLQIDSENGEVMEAFFDEIKRSYKPLAEIIRKSFANTRVKVEETYVLKEVDCEAQCSGQQNVPLRNPSQTTTNIENIGQTNETKGLRSTELCKEDASQKDQISSFSNICQKHLQDDSISFVQKVVSPANAKQDSDFNHRSSTSTEQISLSDHLDPNHMHQAHEQTTCKTHSETRDSYNINTADNTDNFQNKQEYNNGDHEVKEEVADRTGFSETNAKQLLDSTSLIQIIEKAENNFNNRSGPCSEESEQNPLSRYHVSNQIHQAHEQTTCKTLSETRDSYIINAADDTEPLETKQESNNEDHTVKEEAASTSAISQDQTSIFPNNNEKKNMQIETCEYKFLDAMLKKNGCSVLNISNCSFTNVMLNNDNREDNRKTNVTAQNVAMGSENSINC